MSEIVAGAVNGKPAIIQVKTDGVNPIVVPYFPDGTDDDITVDTDGLGFEGAPTGRVAVIGGITPGRDHFTFPVPSGSLDKETIYPMELSFEDCVFAFWRVKRWFIRVDVEVEADDPEDNYTLMADYYADAGGITEDGSSTVAGYESESDLVMPRLTFSSDYSVTSNFVIFSSEDDGFFPAGQRIAKGDSFLPAFYFDLNDAVGTGGYGPDDSGVELEFILPDNPIAGVITLPGASSHGGNVKIFAVEFWPYATKSGEPVYDTSTGAQINDPLS